MFGCMSFYELEGFCFTINLVFYSLKFYVRNKHSENGSINVLLKSGWFCWIINSQ